MKFLSIPNGFAVNKKRFEVNGIYGGLSECLSIIYTLAIQPKEKEEKFEVES